MPLYVAELTVPENVHAVEYDVLCIRDSDVPSRVYSPYHNERVALPVLFDEFEKYSGTQRRSICTSPPAAVGGVGMGAKCKVA